MPLTEAELRALRPRTAGVGTQSGYRFVYPVGGRYRVIVPQNGKLVSVKGTYPTAWQAAHIAAAQLRKMRGPNWTDQKRKS